MSPSTKAIGRVMPVVSSPMRAARSTAPSTGPAPEPITSTVSDSSGIMSSPRESPSSPSVV